MKQLTHLHILLFSVTLALTGCQSLPQQQSTPHPLVEDKDALYEILRYVYLWHFDESLVMLKEPTNTIETWIRNRTEDLDPGDTSEFAEIWIPRAQIQISLKKSNYEVPEMGIVAHDDQFKVTSVQRVSNPSVQKGHYSIIQIPREEISSHLLMTHKQTLFPNEELSTRLRKAVTTYMDESELKSDKIHHTAYVAPISPVSNDLWVYVESEKLLLQFSSDMDLSNPSYWKSTSIQLSVLNLQEDVIVSHHEIPGSNAYVTKDWVGRVLYNCIVLGRKFVSSGGEGAKL